MIPERPTEIWCRGFKCHQGRTIKRWIQFYSKPGNSMDTDRVQVANSMLRFMNIDDDTWYYCSLRSKKGKFVPNLELSKKVREKNVHASRRKSVWYYRRLHLKSLKSKTS